MARAGSTCRAPASSRERRAGCRGRQHAATSRRASRRDRRRRPASVPTTRCSPLSWSGSSVPAEPSRAARDGRGRGTRPTSPRLSSGAPPTATRADQRALACPRSFTPGVSRADQVRYPADDPPPRRPVRASRQTSQNSTGFSGGWRRARQQMQPGAEVIGQRRAVPGVVLVDIHFTEPIAGPPGGRRRGDGSRGDPDRPRPADPRPGITRHSTDPDSDPILSPKGPPTRGGANGPCGWPADEIADPGPVSQALPLPGVRASRPAVR